MKKKDILYYPITLHIPMVAPVALQHFQVFQNTTHTTSNTNCSDLKHHS